MATNVTDKPDEALKTRLELLVMGWIRLLIENKVENIPIECKLICKDFLGGLIDTKILKIFEENILLSYIFDQTKKNWNWRLIMRATENGGFSEDTFYKHCKDIGNTVIIIHNRDDYVIGGYTKCQWIRATYPDSKHGSDENTFIYFKEKIQIRHKYFQLKNINQIKQQLIIMIQHLILDAMSFLWTNINTSQASRDCCFSIL